MHFLDYLIVAVPLLIVLMVAVKTQKYVKNVSDFLTAGRVAGRYVVAVAGGEAGLGLVSVVAMMEMYYNTGFGVVFWSRILALATFFYAMTGYCFYRFRETRAMTLGQFLGMRYGRRFRLTAAVFQSISGILNYALFPAVGARFLVYYLNLPINVGLFGMQFPTFGLLMMTFLGVALIIAMMGGQVTIMVTDCVQGILSYPMYMILVIFVLWKFSWSGEMAPALLSRPPGESFLNPYDIANLRDFNLFYVIASIFMSVFYRMTWSGSQGYNAAAISAHEQKMSGLLANWRTGFSVMMYILLAVAAITYLNHPNYRQEARNVNRILTVKTVKDIADDQRELRDRMLNIVETGSISPELAVAIRAQGIDPQAMLADGNYRDLVEGSLRELDKGKAQSFGTIYRQMQVSVAVREMLPIGITGVFCAIMIFLLVSTDTTYMHSWGSILAQDLILPLLGKPLTPHQQLKLLRCCIAFVAVFAFLFSLLYAQIDYILMFFAITGAIWSTGAGPCIVFGLYSKRGNTAGAFTALFAGSAISVGGILFQQSWATRIYPALERWGLLPIVTRILEGSSRPFMPYIDWTVTPYKFPINSQEMAVISLLVSIGLYMAISRLTARGRIFNLEKMLHRGEYRVEGEAIAPKRIKWWSKIVSITPEYTLGDKVLAWASFVYNFVINTVVFFVLVVIWNYFQPWSDDAWGAYFLYTNIYFSGIVGLISTVWFSIGGTKDLLLLFKRLAAKQSDDSDDGRDTDR